MFHFFWRSGCLASYKQKCNSFLDCLNLRPQTRTGLLPSGRPGGFCRVLLRPNPKPSLWTRQKSLRLSSSPSSSKNWLPSPRSTPSCPTYQWRSDLGHWWLLHCSVYLDKPRENFKIHKKIFYDCYRVFIFCFPAKIFVFKDLFCQIFSVFHLRIQRCYPSAIVPPPSKRAGSRFTDQRLQTRGFKEKQRTSGFRLLSECLTLAVQPWICQTLSGLSETLSPLFHRVLRFKLGTKLLLLSPQRVSLAESWCSWLEEGAAHPKFLCKLQLCLETSQTEKKASLYVSTFNLTCV